MSLVNGKDFIGFIADSGSWKPYVCATDISLSLSTDVIETSVAGNGLWASYVPTKNSFTGSISGLVELSSSPSLTLGDLQAFQIRHTTFQMQFQRTDSDGNVYTTYGEFFITSSSDSGNFNGVDTFSITLQGTGPLSQSYNNPS